MHNETKTFLFNNLFTFKWCSVEWCEKSKEDKFIKLVRSMDWFERYRRLNLSLWKNLNIKKPKKECLFACSHSNGDIFRTDGVVQFCYVNSCLWDHISNALSEILVATVLFQFYLGNLKRGAPALAAALEKLSNNCFAKNLSSLDFSRHSTEVMDTTLRENVPVHIPVMTNENKSKMSA